MQRIPAAVSADHADELDLALNALGDCLREIFRIDFVDRHRRLQAPARAGSIRRALGKPHDPAADVAGDIGHLHRQRVHLSAVELRIGRRCKPDLGRRRIGPIGPLRVHSRAKIVAAREVSGMGPKHFPRGLKLVAAKYTLAEGMPVPSVNGASCSSGTAALPDPLPPPGVTGGTNARGLGLFASGASAAPSRAAFGSPALASCIATLGAFGSATGPADGRPDATGGTNVRRCGLLASGGAMLSASSGTRSERCPVARLGASGKAGAALRSTGFGTGATKSRSLGRFSSTASRFASSAGFCFIASFDCTLAGSDTARARS